MPHAIEVKRGYFTEEQLSSFLDKARDPLELLWWLLMADCGLRIGELRALRWLDIQKGKTRILGKGGKWRTVGPTERVLRMVQYLQKLGTYGEKDLVCPISARSLQKRFDRVCKRARLMEEKLSPHSLRHTFATRALAAGVDIYKVSKLLGHSSVLTTTGYLHMSPGDVNDAAEMVGRLTRRELPPVATAGLEAGVSIPADSKETRTV